MLTINFCFSFVYSHQLQFDSIHICLYVSWNCINFHIPILSSISKCSIDHSMSSKLTNCQLHLQIHHQIPFEQFWFIHNTNLINSIAICLPLSRMFVWLCICMFVCLYVCVSACLSVCLSLLVKIRASLMDGRTFDVRGNWIPKLRTKFTSIQKFSS